MREILFRGKRTDNGEWVYGVPTKNGRGEMVMVENIFECEEYNCRGANCLYVDENTVGQYTGLKDKNGTKIFEGDIILLRGDEEPYQVVFDESCFLVYNSGVCYVMNNFYDYEIEVIGNIYDNPELLGGNNNG